MDVRSIDLKAKAGDVELCEEQLSSVSGGKHVIDKASPVLIKACATGEHMKEATITV